MNETTDSKQRITSIIVTGNGLGLRVVDVNGMRTIVGGQLNGAFYEFHAGGRNFITCSTAFGPCTGPFTGAQIGFTRLMRWPAFPLCLRKHLLVGEYFTTSTMRQDPSMALLCGSLAQLGPCCRGWPMRLSFRTTSEGLRLRAKTKSLWAKSSVFGTAL